MKNCEESDFQENFESFFERSLNGIIYADFQGRILRANSRIAGWLGYRSCDLKGYIVPDLLPIGGKIFYETHLSPLLRMQGFFDEVALEIVHKDGQRLPVFVNALECRNQCETYDFVRLTIFKAIDRSRYEHNLREAKKIAEVNLYDERSTSGLREQFIAILSHDLRNPLGAIKGGAFILLRMPLGEKGLAIAEMINRSAERMSTLINDVMDFARGRLGDGMSLQRQQVLLEPLLLHVVDELRHGMPDRLIKTEFNIPLPVDCDPIRISQLLSNLVANALTHGSADGVVYVRAFMDQGKFELSVSNTGAPIPPDILNKLFEPFTREETRSSQHGLGLGLYIAAEITRAHGGKLSVQSSSEETRFTLRI